MFAWEARRAGDLGKPEKREARGVRRSGDGMPDLQETQKRN